MATVHLTLSDLPSGRVGVHSSFEPHVGAPVTPAQGLSLDLCSVAAHAGHSVLASERGTPLLAFVNSLLDPEGFGYAVTAEVRDGARVALGMPAVEASKYAGAKA